MGNKLKGQKGRKVPKSAQTAPPPKKVPRGENVDFAKGHPVWSFSVLDLDAPIGGWSQLDPRNHVQEVLERFRNWETMTWAEILANKKRNHLIDVEKCVAPAQERLRELKLDDLDRLLSLGVNGPGRVWGILDGATFRLLWWDPDHAICPSSLKHT